ncbi:diacylglycerol kinase [Aurantibacter sp.]|uniref:diacylglycerol kinase n=1 Tax=Aurantibacter sp. TaxID=2807103 RepID=UPI0035C81F64
MNKTKESFLVNRIKSVGYAFKGMLHLLKNEASIKVQFFIALLTIGLGFYFEISSLEWILQTFAIGLVMSIEGVNTAIEKTADFIHPEHHTKIGVIKDVAAGAVCIASFSAIIVGCIIYIPKFMS